MYFMVNRSVSTSTSQWWDIQYYNLLYQVFMIRSVKFSSEWPMSALWKVSSAV